MDLVILVIQLPHISGNEICRYLWFDDSSQEVPLISVPTLLPPNMYQNSTDAPVLASTENLQKAVLNALFSLEFRVPQAQLGR